MPAAAEAAEVATVAVSAAGGRDAPAARVASPSRPSLRAGRCALFLRAIVFWFSGPSANRQKKGRVVVGEPNADAPVSERVEGTVEGCKTRPRSDIAERQAFYDAESRVGHHRQIHLTFDPLAESRASGSTRKTEPFLGEF